MTVDLGLPVVVLPSVDLVLMGVGGFEFLLFVLTVLVEAVGVFFEEDLSFFVSFAFFGFVFLSIFAVFFAVVFAFFFGVGVGLIFAVVFWFDFALPFGVGVAFAFFFGVGVAFFDLFGVAVVFFLVCALETFPINPSVTNSATTIKIPVF